MTSDDKLLEELFKAYYDARKYKRNEKTALAFEIDFEKHIVELHRQLVDRTYRVSRSTCFIVTRPVKREIFAAEFRDRVVHHLVYNYVAPLFERVFIDDSYSCRKGKGTLYGISRVHRHIRSCSDNFTKDAYILKLDIQGYFMNINRQKLYDNVMSVLNKMKHRSVAGKSSVTWADKLDYPLLEFLFDEIIFADPTLDCIIKGSHTDWKGLPPNKSLFGTPPDCGLPIGNLTSQLFSNVYLSPLDDFCKRELGFRHYGRYVDDFVIIHRSKEVLFNSIAKINDFLRNEFALTLHPKKIYLQHYTKGVNFLGVTIKGGAVFPGKRIRKAAFTLVHNNNKKACRWRVHRGNEVKTPDFAVRFSQQVNSYLGQMLHCHGAKMRHQLVRRIEPELLNWVTPSSRSVIVGKEVKVSSPTKVTLRYK